MKIVSIENMRSIEAAADAGGLTYDMMMENAGWAAAELALDMLSDIKDASAIILIGAGNNGGDGLVAARHMVKNGVRVICYMLKPRNKSDQHFVAAQASGVLFEYAAEDKNQDTLHQLIVKANLVIDALFGIGVRLPIRGNAAKLLQCANQAVTERKQSTPEQITVCPEDPGKSPYSASQRILAIDCPSGLDCDSGQLDKNAIHADETITFIAAKPGLLIFPAAAAVGKLHITNIGVPDDLQEIQESQWEIVTPHITKNLLPQRPTDSHKGTYGKALIIAGSVNYTGAPGLAAESAYRAGAGLVTVGAPAPVIGGLSSRLPEPTWLMLAHDMGVISEKAVKLALEQMDGYNALLIGPGLDQEETTGNFVEQLLQQPKNVNSQKRRSLGFGTAPQEEEEESEQAQLPPLVIDADGLNLLSKIDKWWDMLPEGTIITPHPGEMSRLTGIATSEIQSNRWEIAAEKAKEWNIILMLKGAHTLVAAPDGRISALPFKTDSLATAGTGDILAGLIVGLLAQGMKPFAATVVGGYVHGLAGEMAKKIYGSGRGVIAGDVLSAIPSTWNIIESY